MESLYVLDEQYRVILASTPSPDAPLNSFFTVERSADVLPTTIERVVRELTAEWRYGEPRPDQVDLLGLRLNVFPLHGSAGPHIGLYVSLSRT